MSIKEHDIQYEIETFVYSTKDTDPQSLLEEKQCSKIVWGTVTAAITPREEAILRKRIIDNCTLKKIGEEFNISRPRVSQILQKIIKKIKLYNKYKKNIERVYDIKKIKRRKNVK